jgi:hypothetical protein
MLPATMFLLVLDNVMNSHKRQKERTAMENDGRVARS